MSFWEEDFETAADMVSDEIVDLTFRIECKALAIDHGWALSRSILKLLPWIADEPNTALHQILVAESGNGWLAPDSGDEITYPSRRTRLTIRLPNKRVAATTTTLNDTKITLDTGAIESVITLRKPALKPLSKISTIYSRFAIFHPEESENQFLGRIKSELNERGINPKKMLCGRKNIIKGEGVSSINGEIVTHSLMLAELSFAESLALQKRGLNEGKDFGCGIFLPHKGIEDLTPDKE